MNPATRPDNIWLGLDVGTQSVRAIVVSSTGEVLAANSQRLSSRRDDPRHEQSPINRHLIGCEVPTDTSSVLKTGYDLIKNIWPQS